MRALPTSIGQGRVDDIIITCVRQVVVDYVDCAYL